MTRYAPSGRRSAAAMSWEPDAPRPPRRPMAGALPKPPPPQALEAIAEHGDPRANWNRNPPKPIYLSAKDGGLLNAVRKQNGRSEAGLPALATTERLIAAHFPKGAMLSLAKSARQMSPDEALGKLGELGYFASSVTTQARKAGRSADDGYLDRVAPDFERCLAALSHRCGVPPRDTAITAWLRFPPYTWTLEGAEFLYGSAVREAEARLERVAVILENCERGRRPFLDASVELADAATGLKVWHAQVAKGIAPKLGGTATFVGFLREMTVDGQVLEGPTPRQLPSWRQVRSAIDRLTLERWFGRAPLIFQIAHGSDGAHATYRRTTPINQRRRTEEIDQAAKAAVDAAAMIVHVMAMICASGPDAFNDQKSNLPTHTAND